MLDERFTDPAVLAATIIAAFLIGMSRGGFAGAGAMFGVLLLAQFLPPQLAAAFILPVLCFIDPFGNFIFRKHIHWPSVRVLITGGLVGIALGTAAFYVVDDNMVRLFVAALALYLVADRFISHSKPARRYSLPVGLGLGTLTGVSTFMIHAGAPPANAYLLPQRLPRLEFIGTTAVLFTTFNYVKLVPYAGLGLLDWSLLGTAAVFMPVAVVGFYAGKALVKRMSDRVFYDITIVSVLALGLHIGYQGVAGMLGA